MMTTAFAISEVIAKATAETISNVSIGIISFLWGVRGEIPLTSGFVYTNPMLAKT